MKKNKIVIANWKMNKTVSESQKFISELINNRKLKTYENVVICPSFLSIMSILKKCLKNNIKLGAQNCFYEDIGSFTGEVSPIMLKKAGIEYVIIGHSERRIKLNETPDIINKKLFAALKNKLKVILCVGETKTEKDCGTEKSVILNQINSAVYDLQEIEPGIYAYTSTVVSNIPAENYEMCTVLINGQYITIKGTVKIAKSDGSTPKIKWENRHIVNGDTVTIYADINKIKNNGVRTIS